MSQTNPTVLNYGNHWHNMSRQKPLLPGETPDSWHCAKATECTCPPATPPSTTTSAITRTAQYITRTLFGSFDFYGTEDFEEFDENPRKPLRPTLRSSRILQSLPVEILNQILNDVVESSTASEGLCRCMHPGTDTRELKQKYLRWKVVDTKSIRETCSRWHAWASQEHFSQRSGVVLDFSNVLQLRRRLEHLDRRRQEHENIKEEEDTEDHERGRNDTDYEGDHDSSSEKGGPEEVSAYVEDPLDFEGPINRRRPGKKRRKPEKSISSILSFFFTPESDQTTEHADANTRIPLEDDWSIIHKSFLDTFPFFTSGGVSLYLGSPLRISNLERVYELFSTCDIWAGSLLRNGGGISFWDLTFAWREDTDMFERITQGPLKNEKLLKYYDNPDREFWGIDEVNWIIDPSRRPDVTRINSVAQRTHQKYALSRKAHEFIVQERLSCMKFDAKLLLNIIDLLGASSSIQVPINIFALLPVSDWFPIIYSSLQSCQRVDFREFIYCNEKQFSLLVSQLHDSNIDGTEHLPRDVWWNALSVTEQAVNWSVDFLMEKLWEDFGKSSFQIDHQSSSGNAIKELSIGGRGWQRYASHNFTGGLLGRGHERRWLVENFLHRFVFGLSQGPECTASGMGIRGLEKFNLGHGCWAAEISLGGWIPFYAYQDLTPANYECIATLSLLHQSFSASTLRSFTYWPVIPQQSMSNLQAIQTHHCPLLAYFPNLCDVRIYCVCCPEIFKSFLATSSPSSNQNNASPEPQQAAAPDSSTMHDKSCLAFLAQKPSYNPSLPRKWRITIPRVLKSIARGCRDVNQEEEPFWSTGPHETDHEQAKAEWLLKTPSWGLVWSQTSLLDLLSSARAAQGVLSRQWDLEITFEGMVAVESSPYAAGGIGAEGGIHGGRYTGFEGYQGLFPDIPSGALEYKATVFYPLRRPPMVKIVAHEVRFSNDVDEEDDEDEEEMEGHVVVRDDGVRIAWRKEEDFLELVEDGV